MIPLSVPNLSGNEWKYVKECIETNWVSSVGKYVDNFEESIRDFTGAKYAVAVVNGTSALHISLLLSGVAKDDCVIVPNITFIASVNSIMYTGAEPILIDADLDNWQMDLDLLEGFLQGETEVRNGELFWIKNNKRIKAIMPVHVLGSCCDLDRLLGICEKYNLDLIEDSTEALGTKFNGRHVGTFGQFGTFSFNGNKILTTGGGGMIVTNDETLAKKAKHITTQAKSDDFEYIHDEVGYNYRMVNVLAAIGVAQMEQLSNFLTRKQEVAAFYKNELRNINQINFQKTVDQCNPNQWLFTISVGSDKDELMKYLLKKNIQVRPFWKPMNQLQMFRGLNFITRNNHSDVIYNSSLSLPCSTGITDSELKEVASAITEFYS